MMLLEEEKTESNEQFAQQRKLGINMLKRWILAKIALNAIIPTLL